MASLGHVAVGMVAARLFTRRPEGRPTLRAVIGWSALSLLPDLDVIAFAAKIPYGAPFGHRGASHSLAFAMLLGLGAWLVARRLGRPRGRAAWFTALVVASHGVLDAMTDGGKGVALLWPWSTERFFFPWRPIPVAPIGAGMLSERGIEVMLTELVYFAPLLVWALWPGRPASAAGAEDRAPEADAEGSVAAPGDVVTVPIEDAIDLHTFAPRDIASVVDEYLREARRRGLREVRVIHGKGKGVQRDVVRRVLEHHPDVASWRNAPEHRGGWGATVVELKAGADR